MHMKHHTFHWKHPGTEIKADPGATVALDRARWESLGAMFELVDDGDGETPGLAVLDIDGDGSTVSLGVLDYGAAETFLLVPGTASEQHRNVDIALEALTSGGLISQTDIVAAVPGDRRTSQSVRRISREARDRPIHH